jgi:hypothetical protein
MSTVLPLVRADGRAQSRRCGSEAPRTDEETTMTTLPTTLPTTTSHDVGAALDGLAAAAAQAHDDARTRAVLAVVVQRLEDAAGAELGATDGDPLVVLQRRFGRAHARLAAHDTAHVDADLLHDLTGALRPEPAGDLRPALRPTSAAVLAGC